MTPEEFRGLMILGALIAPLLLLSWWWHERGERKWREHERKLNANRTVYMASLWNVSRQEALERLEETDRRIKRMVA